jgi:phosphotransferase system  glucose/maltose/N-acetylglucosamine-specific IIC component
MHTIKQILTPLLTILAAASVIIALLVALETTGWADSFRTTQPEAAVATAPAEDTDRSVLSSVLNAIDAFLKVVLFMGIPGFITYRIIQRHRNRQRRTRLQIRPSAES